mmetsp:Transcript_1671/g.4466  ORF Transcript_1671/g.4466 Transcript_1671/m.4466 type:complete len:272 (+) Transcript_1671:355-1170(+)
MGGEGGEEARRDRRGRRRRGGSQRRRRRQGTTQEEPRRARREGGGRTGMRRWIRRRGPLRRMGSTHEGGTGPSGGGDYRRGQGGRVGSSSIGREGIRCRTESAERQGGGRRGLGGTVRGRKVRSARGAENVSSPPTPGGGGGTHAGRGHHGLSRGRGVRLSGTLVDRSAVRRGCGRVGGRGSSSVLHPQEVRGTSHGTQQGRQSGPSVPPHGASHFERRIGGEVQGVVPPPEEGDAHLHRSLRRRAGRRVQQRRYAVPVVLVRSIRPIVGY